MKVSVLMIFALLTLGTAQADDAEKMSPEELKALVQKLKDFDMSEPQEPNKEDKNSSQVKK